MKLLGAKLLIVAVVYLPLQLKIGRGLDAWLLSFSMLFNAISLFVHIPPSVGIHKSGLFLENAWLKWDTVRRYRWTNPGTLEINPGSSPSAIESWRFRRVRTRRTSDAGFAVPGLRNPGPIKHEQGRR